MRALAEDDEGKAVHTLLVIADEGRIGQGLPEIPLVLGRGGLERDGLVVDRVLRNFLEFDFDR